MAIESLESKPDRMEIYTGIGNMYWKGSMFVINTTMIRKKNSFYFSVLPLCLISVSDPSQPCLEGFESSGSLLTLGLLSRN